MGDVVSLQEHTPEHIFPQESTLYFPIYERPVFFSGRDGNMYENPEYKAIVRLLNDTPKQIGMVKKTYEVLKMKDLCQAIEANFLECLSMEELEGVSVIDSISYHGGMLFRQYIFPAVSTDIGTNTSKIAYRVIVGNGYDGSTSFKLYHGAIDFFCLNGMVSGIYDMIVRRHTAGISIPSIADRIRKGVGVFYKQADQFRGWVGKEITDEQARKVFEAVPNVSERRIEQFMRQFHIECLTHGRTVWALYSAATFYSSHDEGMFSVRTTSNDNTAATLMNRETQIRGWLSTDEFQQIAA